MAKARVEEEVIATAGIATGLEARLRQARQDAFLAQQQAQQAELRATQVGCCCAPWGTVLYSGVWCRAVLCHAVLCCAVVCY